MRQALLPVLGEDALVGDRIDVVGQRQGHDIGVDAVDDGARLLAGAAVRCADLDVVAGLGLVILGKSGIVFLVKLAGRVIGHVQQRHFRRVGGRHGKRKRGTNLEQFFEQHLIFL